MKKLLGIAFVGMMALGCGGGAKNTPEPAAPTSQPAPGADPAAAPAGTDPAAAPAAPAAPAN